MPIKILHLITTLDKGGAELNLLKLVSLMDRKKYSNQVVSLSKLGSVGKEMKGLGIKVHALNINGPFSFIKGFLQLLALLFCYKPDVLQTWLYHSDLLGLICGKITFVKTICWNIRGSLRDFSEYGATTRLAVRLCKYLSSIPSTVISNSEAGKKFHSEFGYKARDWLIIPNGIDLEKFKPDSYARSYLISEIGKPLSVSKTFGKTTETSEIVDGVFFVGLIARHHPIKDHSTFINGASLILEKRKDVQFILAGHRVKWENNQLSEQIPDEYENHFHLLGIRDDIQKITAALDIATLVSYGEGFSNVICEAMASAVPCVVTNVGDSAKIVGDTGLVVPPRDPAKFAYAIERLLSLPRDELKKMGEQARERIKNKYSLDKIVASYEKFYSDISMRSNYAIKSTEP